MKMGPHTSVPAFDNPTGWVGWLGVFLPKKGGLGSGFANMPLVHLVNPWFIVPKIPKQPAP